MGSIFAPASPKQEMMFRAATEAQIVVIGGAAGCVDDETEFLSDSGWKSIKDYVVGDKVFQINPDTLEGELIEPVRYIKEPVDFFYTLQTQRGLNQYLTPEHKNYLTSPKGRKVIMSMQETVEAHEASQLGLRMGFTPVYKHSKGFSLGLSEDLIRFQIALKADGHIVNDNTKKWRVRLLKDRKIERFEPLLQTLKITYTKKYEEATGFTLFDFYLDEKTHCSKLFSDWMFCSYEDAKVIVDELKYWDGYLAVKGNRMPAITTVSKECADAIQYFFNICGLKASLRSDNRKGQTYKTNGKEYIRKQDCYQITPTKQTLLKLDRKPNKKIEIGKDYSKDFKYCFEVPSGFFLIRRGGDVVVTGNSGKSYILQLLPLLLVDDPNTKCVMFRRTIPQITGQGGIWDTAKGIYNQLPKLQRPKIRENKLDVTFPNGSTVKYQHMERESDKLNIQGLQFTMIGVDEATQFEWSQLEYMMSRLRSESRHFSRMIMSCNPDPDHELCKLIKWYLDDEGYPIPERDGVVRYFIREDGEFLWGDSREELGEKFNIPPDKWEAKILSFTFVSAKIYDNPPMCVNNPSYVAFLEGLNPVDKAQLLHGCWYARPKGANYFERDWLKNKDRIPFQASACRAYDLAATERSQVNKTPDATASIKMYKDREGYFYIVGDYHKDFKDEVLDVEGRMLKRVGDRDNVMLLQAKHDGDDVPIVLPVDPAAAGKQVYNEMAKKFGSHGYRVKKDPVAGNKAKLTRFLPFADAAENGLVFIVKPTFDSTTYDFIMKELESFNGERSTTNRKDDFVDCIATAYNYLCTERSLDMSAVNTALGGSLDKKDNKTLLAQSRNKSGMKFDSKAISSYRQTFGQKRNPSNPWG